MGTWIELKAGDGQTLSAYLTRPEGVIKGSLVLVQEIFGVNEHIRSVAESFVEQGYAVIAPALFDRFEPGVQLQYEGEDVSKAFALYAKLTPELALLDVAAAFSHVAEQGKGVAVLGFCYGGLMAWLAATRGPGLGMYPRCTVGYYAGGIGTFAKEDPSCPVMLHFGAEDSHIGGDQIDAVREAHPEVQVFVYEGAGHAFNRKPDPKSYAPEAAALARQRTLAFLSKYLT